MDTSNPFISRAIWTGRRFPVLEAAIHELQRITINHMSAGMFSDHHADGRCKLFPQTPRYLVSSANWHIIQKSGCTNALSDCVLDK